MERQGFKAERYVIAAVITSLIFILGISIGLLLSKEKVTRLESQLVEMKTGIENVELQFMFSDVMKGENYCNYLLSQAVAVGNKADELGSRLATYDSTRKLDEPIRETKTKYMLLLVRQWLYLEKIRSACKGNYDIVLYFYSTDNCTECREQGVILTSFKQKMSNKLMIIPLDIDINIPIMSTLVEAYNINQTPALVAGPRTYWGLIGKDLFGEILASYEQGA